MSRPSEPVETVSTSMERSFLPSFITEPLPNWRSIWDSAAESALLLSMEEPSTIRRAVTDIGLAPYGGEFVGGETVNQRKADVANKVTPFFHVCKMFFPERRVSVFIFHPPCRPVWSLSPSLDQRQRAEPPSPKCYVLDRRTRRGLLKANRS